MKKSSLKWLYTVTGKYKIGIAVLLLIQAILGISGVVFALLLRNIIDLATSSNKSGFFTYMIFIIGLVVLQISLRAVTRYLEELLRSSIENVFKDRFFANLMTKSYSLVTATHSGEWLNRLTSDTVVCANGIVEILPQVAGMLIKMLGALVMILALEPKFAYVILPSGIILILLTYLFRKKLKRLHKDVQEKDGNLRVFLQERLCSMLIVRSFVAESQTQSEALCKMDCHKSARMCKNRFSNFCNVGFALAMNGMYLIGLGYCGYGILLDKISYGTLTAILQLISQIQSPFANITGYLPKFYAMTASAERLMTVESYPDNCPNCVISAKEIQDLYTSNFSAISFENVSFSYKNDGNLKVLENVNLQIKKGEYVAFMGQSGCGKSTLLKLMMCLYPVDSGECFLLKNNDEKEKLTSQWQRLFAYVPQGNQLMSGTIREVIAFSDKEKMYDDVKIRYALKIACADFVYELENGIDTMLGERGQGLSEGQMQRIAVARAIFSDNPILLLDESTSAVDEITEKHLLENLRNMTDKTVIIVTHRPAVLNICNKIVKIYDNAIEVNYIS